jgi:RNA polymerase sigma-70 factor (ECF subfamily)
MSATFEELRPRLIAIAYLMLGAAGEAEDVVQDAWLRWQAAHAWRVRARPPRRFLTLACREARVRGAMSWHAS